MNLPPYATACQSLSCHPGDFPAVAPFETVPDVNGSVRASYACPVCGARWHCWWDAKASRWPLRIETELPELRWAA